MTPRTGPRAFTLIEMTVTLVLLGALLAASVVSWSWFTARVKDQEAGALLDRVVTVEQSIARDWGSYTAWPADLADVGADVTVLNGRPSRSPREVSVAVGSAGSLVLAVRLASGRCLVRLVDPLASGGGSSTPPALPASSPCTAQAALPGTQSTLTQTGSVRILPAS